MITLIIVIQHAITSSKVEELHNILIFRSLHVTQWEIFCRVIC